MPTSGKAHRRWFGWVLRAMVVTIAVTAIAWHLHGGHEAGVPVVRTVEVGGALPVLVVPNRPGWNLVHVPGAVGGTTSGGGQAGVSVGTDRDRLAPLAARPGASGGWGLVELPAGASRLWVGRGGHVAELSLNTGDSGNAGDSGGGRAGVDLTGPDGPECAAAVLGRIAAGAGGTVTSCPADTLSEADASALRGTVRFLAQRGHRAITLVADGSPRSSAAADVVRTAGAAGGLAVEPAGAAAVTADVTADVTAASGQPVVVVAGWATADRTLRKISADPTGGSGGAYLAPWLLHAPVLTTSVAQLVPLNYSPRDDARPRQYLTALHATFPGEPASASGYAAWLQAGGADRNGADRNGADRNSADRNGADRNGADPDGDGASRGSTYRLYAAARMAVPGPAPELHTHGVGWLPQGTLTPVTAPLNVGS